MAEDLEAAAQSSRILRPFPLEREEGVPPPRDSGSSLKEVIEAVGRTL